MQVDIEVIRDWIESLRSGEYQQTRGYMYRPPEKAWPGHPCGYCCLGVAREVLRNHGYKVPRRRPRSNKHDELLLPTLGERQVLGLRLAPCTSNGTTTTHILSHINDTHELTFDQIADILESKLLRPLERALESE